MGYRFLYNPLSEIFLHSPKYSHIHGVIDYILDSLIPFFYNKIYIKGLIKKGFKAESLHSAYPSAGIDSLDSLLDSLSTKWNMEIPRLETENDGEETHVG